MLLERHCLFSRDGCLTEATNRSGRCYPFVGVAVQRRTAMAPRLKMLYVVLMVLLALSHSTAGAANGIALSGTQSALLTVASSANERVYTRVRSLPCLALLIAPQHVKNCVLGSLVRCQHRESIFAA